jgi:predicted nucleic acid-binding protein
MSVLLERAEKNAKRTTKAAAAFREELTKANGKVVQKEQTLNLLLQQKDSKIRDLDTELNRIKNELEMQRLKLAEEEERKKKKKMCLIS